MDESNLEVKEPKLNPLFNSKEKKKAENFSVVDITEELFISKHTPNHRKHIRQKLERNTTAGLFRYIHAFDLFLVFFFTDK